MPDPDYKAIAQTLDKFLTQSHAKNLILGETPGSDNKEENLKLLADPNIQAVLQKHYIHDISLGARHEFQADADQVAAGKISPAALGQRAVAAYSQAGDSQAELSRSIYEARGNLIAASEPRGMTVHFSEAKDSLRDYVSFLNVQDHQNAIKDQVISGSNLMTNLVDSVEYKMSSIFNSQSGMDDATRREQRANDQALIDNPRTARILKDNEQEQRQSFDPKFVDAVKSQTDGRNTVILYGADHAGSLKAGLGEGTIAITLCRDHKDIIAMSEKDKTLGASKPDAYLDIQNAKLIDATGVNSQLQQNIQQAPASPRL